MSDKEGMTPLDHALLDLSTWIVSHGGDPDLSKAHVELAELRRDRERLEWLFDSGHVFNLNSMIRKVSNGWRYSMAIKDSNGGVENIRHWGGDTFRAAIDAAMEAGK